MPAQRSLISWILAATLLLGQWLGAAHDADHELQPGAAHTCAICVYSHGGGTGLISASPTLVIAGAHAAPDLLASADTLEATRHDHPIRGPPALLV